MARKENGQLTREEFDTYYAPYGELSSGIVNYLLNDKKLTYFEVTTVLALAIGQANSHEVLPKKKSAKKTKRGNKWHS